MDKVITKDQMKVLKKAQQGEIDAVLMYNRLAGKVKTVDEALAFKRLARDEARHADVFYRYTGRTLRPIPVKAIMVPLMYKFLGKEKTYKIVAQGEYDAADKYKHIISLYPEVEEVMNDEVHHGDAVLSLLK